MRERVTYLVNVVQNLFKPRSLTLTDDSKFNRYNNALDRLIDIMNEKQETFSTLSQDSVGPIPIEQNSTETHQVNHEQGIAHYFTTEKAESINNAFNVYLSDLTHQCENLSKVKTPTTNDNEKAIEIYRLAKPLLRPNEQAKYDRLFKKEGSQASNMDGINKILKQRSCTPVDGYSTESQASDVKAQQEQILRRLKLYQRGRNLPATEGLYKLSMEAGAGAFTDNTLEDRYESFRHMHALVTTNNASHSFVHHSMLTLHTAPTGGVASLFFRLLAHMVEAGKRYKVARFIQNTFSQDGLVSENLFSGEGVIEQINKINSKMKYIRTSQQYRIEALKDQQVTRSLGLGEEGELSEPAQQLEKIDETLREDEVKDKSFAVEQSEVKKSSEVKKDLDQPSISDT